MAGNDQIAVIESDGAIIHIGIELAHSPSTLFGLFNLELRLKA
jgi:hypothetical protein